MGIPLKNVHSLQAFRVYLGDNPQVDYIRGRGKKVNRVDTVNELAFKLSKLRPHYTNTEGIRLFEELRRKVWVLNNTKVSRVGMTKCEIFFVRLRQALGNCWFKLTRRFDRDVFLHSAVPSLIQALRQEQPITPQPKAPKNPLDVIVEHTPAFTKYQIPLPQHGEGTTVGLTAFTLRPANLFFQSLFKDTVIETTLPGEGLFAFNASGEVIREVIDQKAPEEIVEFSARGIAAAVAVNEGYVIDDLADVYGDKVYQISYKEIQDLLNSQKIYTSKFLPLKFYSGLKEALKQTQNPVLPGSDEKPLRLLDMTEGPIKEFLDQVDKDPLAYGFKYKPLYERTKKWTLYEIGSMVVKTEDYYLFMDDAGKILPREQGTKDAFRLINACGIRGFSASKTSVAMKQNIMKETFKTALTAAENGIVIFPAVGMGVWGGPPELYWQAFLDAVVESPHPFERIFVNPGHQKTIIGKHKGSQGEEFQHYLDNYAHKNDPEKLEKIKKITNLFDQKTDLLQLAHHLKQAFNDKTVSLFNASDPDVTLGWHVGEYTNNMPHEASTTEEHFTAMGTNGLCFEDITGVHKDPARLIHVS